MILTKRESEVLSLYKKGLTFKEMGILLGIATRTAINYLMRVKAKDKQLVKRAKATRAKSRQLFKDRFTELVKSAKHYNKFTTKQISIKSLLDVFKSEYFNECLVFAFRSYQKMKLKKVKLLQVIN